MAGSGGGEPEKRKGLPKGVEFILDVVAADGYGTDRESTLTERDHGRLRVKQWGKFARKQGLEYRERLEPGDLRADPRLTAFFEEVQGLGFPLNDVSGLLQGSWQGCPVTGFHTHNATADGKISPYRMVFTRLSREYPDLVSEFHLRDKTNAKAQWYPAFEEYRPVTGPPVPRAKEPGLLGRTKVGKTLGNIFSPIPPTLYTASTEFAERFYAAAYRQYDAQIFKYSWAVRGSWLVSYEFDGLAGLTDNGKRAKFLDMLVRVRGLVEHG